MNIVSWVLFGIIIGIIAYAYTTKDYEKNLWVSVALGISGSLVGGFLAKIIFGIGITGFSITSFIIAMYVSVILLFLSKTIVKV